jgi:hypothetical protein
MGKRISQVNLYKNSLLIDKLKQEKLEQDKEIASLMDELNKLK